MLQTTICVTDANFWIDLDVAGVLAIPFQLPCHWVSPDLVVAELVQTDGQYIVSLGLEVMELSGVEITNVIALRGLYNRVSVPDLSALVLTKRLDATLITGDGNLRAAADTECVEVHGTLWVLDFMVERYHVLDPLLAVDALATMVARGRRLPHGEVRRRYMRWSSEE